MIGQNWPADRPIRTLRNQRFSADTGLRKSEETAHVHHDFSQAQAIPRDRSGLRGAKPSLNWLALGLLLAAWNASDNDAAANVRRRPEALRGYPYVSVRAAQRVASVER